MKAANNNLNTFGTINSASYFDEYFFELRLQLAKHMSYAFFFLFLLLSIINFLDSIPAFIPMFLGFIICCISIYTTSKGWYLPSFYLFSFGGVFISGFALILLTNNIHLSDMLWMLAAVSLSFFGINRKVGLLLITCSLTLIAIFMLVSLNKQILASKPVDLFQKISLTVELTGAILVNFYVFYLFLKLNRFAKIKLQDSYDNLLLQNRQIVNQSNENTLLLKEVHHRVKNNLQMVISILRMQGNENKSQQIQEQFQKAINRILSMSLVHQKLYQNEHLSLVLLEDYLKDLSREVIVQADLREISVRTEIHSEIEKLGLKLIIPFGLIINELINETLNSVDDSQTSVSILINVVKSQEDIVKVTYTDNVSRSVYQMDSNSFGFVFVDDLLLQMKGFRSTELDNHKQVHVISFQFLPESEIME